MLLVVGRDENGYNRVKLLSIGLGSRDKTAQELDEISIVFVGKLFPSFATRLL